MVLLVRDVMLGPHHWRQDKIVGEEPRCRGNWLGFDSLGIPRDDDEYISLRETIISLRFVQHVLSRKSGSFSCACRPRRGGEARTL
jgi:hypothetical protein